MVGKVERFILIYMLFVFSVIIIPLNNDKMQSVPMLLVMFICPFLLCINLIFKLKKNKETAKVTIPKTDLFAYLLILMIVLTSLINISRFRLSTVVYSCLFIGSFLYFSSAFRLYPLGLKTIAGFCSLIVKLYTIVLVVQQICSLSGLPIINESYNVEGLKCNSLANEPSQGGIVVSILLITFIRVKEMAEGKGRMTLLRIWYSDKILCLSYLYFCLMSSSVSCVICLLLVCCYFISGRTTITVLGIFVVVFIVIVLGGTEIGGRIKNLVPAMIQMNPQIIYDVDASSAARIAPYLVYFQELDLSDIHFWIGNGCDYGGIHIYSVMADTELEENLGVGGLVNFLYDFGLLSFLPLLCLVAKLTGIKSFEFFFFVIIVSVCSFNLHILWLFLFLEYVQYWYRRKWYFSTTE